MSSSSFAKLGKALISTVRAPTTEEVDDSKFARNPLLGHNIIEFKVNAVVPWDLLKPDLVTGADAIREVSALAQHVNTLVCGAPGEVLGRPACIDLPLALIYHSREAKPAVQEFLTMLMRPLASSCDVKEPQLLVRQFDDLKLFHISLATPASDGLVPAKVLECHCFPDTSGNAIVYNVRPSKKIPPDFSQLLSHRIPATAISSDGKRSLSLSTRGVDATGLVRRWLSEDLFAEIIMRWGNLDKRLFEGMDVVELGAGRSGLAGLAVSLLGSQVILTDGHLNAVRQLAAQASLNCDTKRWIAVDCAMWDMWAALERAKCGGVAWPATPAFAVCGTDRSIAALDGRADLILAADTTFFTEFHIDQLFTIYSILKQKDPSYHVVSAAISELDTSCVQPARSVLDLLSMVLPKDMPQAWLLAPSRGRSLEEFVDLARKFQVTVQDTHTGNLRSFCPFLVFVFDKYDEEVSRKREELILGKVEEVPMFDEDIHYPLLVILQKHEG